jgi:hypothetical protein
MTYESAENDSGFTEGIEAMELAKKMVDPVTRLGLKISSKPTKVFAHGRGFFAQPPKGTTTKED